MIHSLQPSFLTTLKNYMQLENKKSYFTLLHYYAKVILHYYIK